MKTKRLLAVMMIGSAVAAGAASPSGAGMRDSLTTSDNLGPVSAGFDYQTTKRTVSLDAGGKNVLQARVMSAEIGVDLFPWWQVFGTLGRSEAGWDTGNYGDGKVKWSGGMHFNWWNYDITEPEFMEGRLSFQTTLEFAQYRSGDDTHWNDAYADLTLNYELFAEKQKDTKAIPYSLALYGGAALSKLSGQLNGSGFSEDQIFGLVGGADLYIAQNLSLGAQVLYFDKASVGFSVRYHF
ncbi:MAG: hypothetical protein NTY53_05810 [Kiritimatiellaeota bacterium]|nr:hypothetical protein [Kiritimatiellota bacterium]